jgi:iron complex outermembrane receptor protein
MFTLDRFAWKGVCAALDALRTPNADSLRQVFLSRHLARRNRGPRHAFLSVLGWWRRAKGTGTSGGTLAGLRRASLVLLVAHASDAQSVSGRLVNSLSGDPIPQAAVVVEGRSGEVTSAADGSFTIDGLAAGTHHLTVKAQGYSSRRTEFVVPAAGPLTVEVDPELHFEQVVSVSPEARSQFDAFQPTTVLAGQELTKQLDVSLGETLRNQPGVSVRNLGAAPARPVIRGLDGDRVLILQDGQRTGDLSSQSADHGVAINPAAAQRIEVVRGPATLLYGANAIGGLVNVITDEIPTAPFRGTKGAATFDLATVGAQAGTAADVHVGNGRSALHAGGGGRRSSNLETPLGSVDNSQSRSGFGSVGLGWTGTKSFLGGSYGHDNIKYGIPVIENGDLQLSPRRHAFTLRAGADKLNAPFEAYRLSVAHRRYKHEELQGTAVGTRFRNNTTELQLLGSHRAAGRLKGSVGFWALDRAFAAVGEEALSPAVDQRGFAAFVYEEVTWPHVTVQFGGRVDRTNLSPEGESSHSYTNGSGSLGLLLRPAAGNEALTFALSLARAARAPSLEELFYLGEHHGNFAFEVGNPGLESERALGVDASVRWRTRRMSGEFTYFRNSITNFIFASPLTEDEFEDREAEFENRFPGRPLDHAGHGHGGDAADLEFVEFIGADSLLQGVEMHTDVQISSRLVAEGGFDYVRGELRDSGLPLPRIPPFRVRGGLRYQYSGFQAGGEAMAVADQNRVFVNEDPTAGYGFAKLFASYSFAAGGATHTITARLDNASNTLYRNHLSRIRDVVPELGRNFRVVYNVAF